jgi:hypothetical protein
MAMRDHNVLTVDVAAGVIVTGEDVPVAQFVVPNALAVKAQTIIAGGRRAVAVVEDGRTVVDVREDE